MLSENPLAFAKQACVEDFFFLMDYIFFSYELLLLNLKTPNCSHHFVVIQAEYSLINLQMNLLHLKFEPSAYYFSSFSSFLLAKLK